MVVKTMRNSELKFLAKQVELAENKPIFVPFFIKNTGHFFILMLKIKIELYDLVIKNHISLFFCLFSPSMLFY